MSHSDAELALTLASRTGAALLDLRSSYGDISDPEVAARLRLEGDRVAEALIAEALLAARPDDAVLSEEAADSAARLSADRVWIIDPLDGTWEYGQGRADFAVHVALWAGGALVCGAVDLPARGRTHSTLFPSVVPPLGPVALVVSRSRPPAQLEELVTGTAGLLGCEVLVRRVGSAGAKAAEVIEGSAAAYVHDQGLSEWDVAAPAAVAAAAGLSVSGLDGRTLEFNRMPPYVGDLVIGVPVVAEALRTAYRSLG